MSVLRVRDFARARAGDRRDRGDHSLVDSTPDQASRALGFGEERRGRRSCSILTAETLLLGPREHNRFRPGTPAKNRHSARGRHQRRSEPGAWRPLRAGIKGV